MTYACIRSKYRSNRSGCSRDSHTYSASPEHGTIVNSIQDFEGISPMSDERREPNRPQERKTPPMGGNVVWYLVALGIVAVFLISSMDTNSQVKLKYSDLQTLIEKGAAAKNPKAAIEVREGSAREAAGRSLLGPRQSEVRPARNHRHGDPAGSSSRRPTDGAQDEGRLSDAARRTGERQQRPVQSGEEEGIHRRRARKRQAAGTA